MTKERKADLEAKLAELEHELYLAIKQGVIESLQWSHVIHVGDDPWLAVLTVGRVAKEATR